jgi:hypothetical protein
VAVAGTTTEPGSVRRLAMEAEITTEVPPVGAALDRVTVQVVPLLDTSAVAAHCKDETRGRVTKATVALLPAEPLREAVTVAL